jgi:uncharacterized protein (TIGR01244 family)
MLWCHRGPTLSRSFSLKPIQVNDRLSIGAQPNLSEFRWLRANGFAAVVNHRPDGEESSQPTADEASREAESANLSYVRQPVTLGAITEDDVRRFQRHVATLEGPVFAHCRSGTRSLTLWALGEFLDGRLQPSEIIPFGRQFGIDLQAAAAWAAKYMDAKQLDAGSGR